MLLWLAAGFHGQAGTEGLAACHMQAQWSIRTWVEKMCLRQTLCALEDGAGGKIYFFKTVAGHV